ncbi:hypothetical protein SLS54_010037 [Diplodia seriata]
MATAAQPDTKPAQVPPPTTTQKPANMPPRHPHNAGALLESMQAMLNGALLEVGHSMKNPQRPKLTFPSTQGLNGPRHNNISISASYERFHHCLDEIENELCRAKAVLRRDLAVQREEREKREKEEQERAAEAAQKIAAEKKAAAPVPVAPVKQEQRQQKDVDMADAPAAATHSSKPTADAPSVAAHTHLPPRPPAIQTQVSAGDSAQPAPATATTDDLFGRTPTTAGVNNNADFDSMFEDFAASNDNENNGSDTNMDGNDEFDFALLPGLESYANSDTNAVADESGTSKDAAPEIDFTALDKAAEQKAAEEEQKKKQEEEEKKKKEEQEKKMREEEEKKKKEEEEQKKKDEAQQSQQQQENQDIHDMFGQGDSTFDDLFNYTDFDMAGTGSTGGGDTTFDDDFFNI